MFFLKVEAQNSLLVHARSGIDRCYLFNTLKSSMLFSFALQVARLR